MKTDVSAPEIPFPETIDRQIAGFPSDVQNILEDIRTIFRTAAPTAQETIQFCRPQTSPWSASDTGRH